MKIKNNLDWGGIVMALLLGFMSGWNWGQGDIAKDCQRLGAFYERNVNYTCEVKKENQDVETAGQ